MEYLISFDLRKPDVTTHDDIYRWIHANGGYRYVQKSNGRCTVLPGTCVVYRTKLTTEGEAMAEFIERLFKDLKIQLRNVCAIRGIPTGLSLIVDSPVWLTETNDIDAHSDRLFGYLHNLDLSPGMNCK